MKKLSIIEAKFLRNDLVLQWTKLWRDMDEVTRNLILDKVTLGVNEEFVLSYFPIAEYWWVLTTKRLVIYHNGGIQSIELYSIDKIELKEVFDGSIKKHDNTTLDVHFGDNTSKIYLEKKSWPVIYGVLKFVVN